jgi:hypothetical protein
LLVAFEAFHVPIGAKWRSDAANAVQQRNFAPAAMLSKEAETALLIL